MLASLIFSLFLSNQISSVQSADVKIMSFNIDCRFCDLKHENGDSWNDRVQNELDTIARHNPDIIGMEEPIFDIDVKQLTPDGYTAIYFNESQFLPWGSYPDATILFKTDRFSYTDFNMFWLGPNASFPAGFDRLALPRLAVYALFTDKTDNSKFYFGATHFDHGDDMEGSNVDCVESAYELLDFTTPLAEKYPVIWVGDFNSETTNNNAYSILTNETAAFHLEDSYFVSPTHEVFYNQETQPAYDYDHSIDHIFYGNNKEIASYEVKDWAVDMYVYGEKQQYASDHWAIVSTINIQQK